MIAPGVGSVNTVFAVRSPQSIVTCHGLSAPGSVKLPRSNRVEAPSLAVWLAGAVITGITLAISTVWLAMLLGAPSESLTWTDTSEVSSPSGKRHTKLPPVWVTVVVPCWVPASPQSTDSTVNVSAPGSVTLNVYVRCRPRRPTGR